MLNISLGCRARFKLLMNPRPQNLPRCLMALMEKLVQIHKAYGHMTLDVSGTEALHPNGAALKAMPGSLGNRRSINTFIFMFLMMIKKTKQQC